MPCQPHFIQKALFSVIIIQMRHTFCLTKEKPPFSNGFALLHFCSHRRDLRFQKASMAKEFS
uniref:Uncharacterized protein n=1 Tax=Anopheles dirus TaxID=7168 RepID=A0A182NYA4_9DIPT